MPDNRRWVVKCPQTPISTAFPSAEAWADLAAEFEPTLPVPLLPKPLGGRHSQSHRIRERRRGKLEIWRCANGILATLNSLDEGHCRPRITTHRKPRVEASLQSTLMCQTRVRELALRESLRLRMARRDFDLSGAPAVAALLKEDRVDRYGSYDRATGPQTELIAEKVDEPSPGRHVMMLDALPPEEASFYAEERHVVDAYGKSDIIFSEIEDRYGFVGGSYKEYAAYFSRQDVGHLWDFETQENVRAVAGFSTVRKKSGRLRKLLMQCSANYMLSDVRARASQGMLGGSALGSVCAPSDEISASSFDESNAFTAVETPRWMWPWTAVPPLRAEVVWDRLRPEVRAKVHKWSWIYPLYTRLAMGSTHSVHILMSINIRCVGMALAASSRLKPVEDVVPQEDELPRELLEGGAASCVDSSVRCCPRGDVTSGSFRYEFHQFVSPCASSRRSSVAGCSGACIFFLFECCWGLPQDSEKTSSCSP